MGEQLIIDSLNSLKSIRLDEMDQIRLMNRTESKYILPFNRLPDLLNQIPQSYKALEISNNRIFSYHNTYLDTENYFFFNQHITGKLSRHKVRFREYSNTGVTYLEVKKRTNRNRVVKWRINNGLMPGNRFTDEAADFITEHIKEKHLLKPVLINKFRRITLAGQNNNERVTLDFDISFSDFNGRSKSFPFLSVIEIKKQETSTKSLLGDILKVNFIHQSGFSKYCMGNAVINNPPKLNILKSKFMKLNKIENEYNTSLR